MDNDYLIHYGIPKRSGRYPYGSGKRPFQSVKTFFSPEAKTGRINRRATKRLNKYEATREGSQNVANKYFDKAARKSTARFFSSQSKVDKLLSRATNAQKVVNRMEYKGEKYYKKVQRKLSRIDGEIDPYVQKLGEQYVKRVAETSKAMHNTMLMSNGTIRYRGRR